MDTQDEFRAFWSFDPDGSGDVTLAGEKRAFEQLMDFLTDRLERYPEMHVYHYASYEPTALKRLMGRHGTREEQVDRLLRGGVLVDLFRAVRQGLRASVESYSIKKIEALYDFTRQEGLRDAGSSIVEFEEWLQLGETDRPSSSILGSIETYNRDDVLSTLRLRDWLELQRLRIAEVTGQDVPRPAPRSPDAPEQLREADAHVQEVAARLTDGVPDDPLERTPLQQAPWLLAQLLSWHRREAKVAFWDFFHRLGMDVAELAADKQALGPLEVVGPIGEPWKPSAKAKYARQTWRYRYAAQDYDIGSDLYDPALYRQQPDAKWSAWKVRAEVRAVDDRQSTVDLAWPAGTDPPHPEALVPLNIYGDKEQRAALLRLGEWVAEHGIDAPGPWRAARDVLLRRPPSVGQVENAPLQQPGETGLDAACRIVEAMDHGALAIQGPPGSGKTYTGARMVVRLAASGRKVGISANSHKVIGNFLKNIEDAAAEAGVPIRCIQKITEDDQAVDDDRVTITKDNDRDAGRHRERRLRRRCRDRLAVGAEQERRAARRAVRRRGGPDVARQRARHVGRRSLDRPARRSAAARPAAPGLASARRRPIGAGAPPRRARRHARATSASSSSTRGGSTPTSPSSRRTRSTRASSSRARTSAASSCTVRRRWSGPACD